MLQDAQAGLTGPLIESIASRGYANGESRIRRCNKKGNIGRAIAFGFRVPVDVNRH